MPLACCCLALVLPTVTAARAETTGVVELFTSQGCSSCPPADRVLGKLAADPSLLALTFAVDYWDYLGWKDSYARPEFTKRQRAYARARGDRAVFTPQAVINGREAVIGSREDEIRAELSRMRDTGEAPSVHVSARIDGDRVVVTVPEGAPGPTGHAALWIAGYLPPQKVDVGSGENHDQQLTYYNIVNRWQVLGMWDGKPLTVELPLSDIAQEGTDGLAVILQTKDNGMPGPILGAARIDLSSGS